MTGLQRGGEDVELAEEAAGEGNPDQREQEEGQQRGEHGTAQCEALVVGDGAQRLLVSADLGDDGEGADVHGGVGCGIEAGSGDAILREGREGHQQVACMGDAGVGEQALDMVCISAPRLPMVIERAASTHIRMAQRCCIDGKPEKVMRSSTAKAAALGAVDIRPTTGAGAPW